jgi:hypothetical protein
MRRLTWLVLGGLLAAFAFAAPALASLPFPTDPVVWIA